jgi:hypothetical protein
MDPKIIQYTQNLILGRLTKERILADLIEKGLNEIDALEVLTAVENDLLEAKKTKGKANIIFGVIFFTLGIGLTITTIYMARHGGFYIITFGLIVGGLLKFLQGLSQYFSKSPIDSY